MKVLLIISIFLLGFEDSSSEEQRQSCLNRNTDLLLTSIESSFALLRQMIDSSSRKQDCPAGFSTYPGYNDSCYMLITTKHDWDGAGDYCRRLAKGAHLVAMETEKEDQAIINHLNSLWSERKLTGLCNSWNDFNVYTSGQTMNATNCHSPFYWKPFKINNMIIPYTNFQPDEPSNCATCLQYWRGSAHTSFKWDDGICSYPHCFLCEYER
jgi:hypothetical protein